MKSISLPSSVSILIVLTMTLVSCVGLERTTAIPAELNMNNRNILEVTLRNGTRTIFDKPYGAVIHNPTDTTLLVQGTDSSGKVHTIPLNDVLEARVSKEYTNGVFILVMVGIVSSVVALVGIHPH